jgi:hypothetical protein
MKKTTFILFLSLIITSVVHAENNFGIKGGMNVADQYISYNGNSLATSPYTGFHAGLFYKVEIPFGLGVQIETLYSQKGCYYTTGNAKVRNRFDYLDIPVYLRWTLKLPLIQPYIGAGPYFSFPLNMKVRGTDDSSKWANTGFNDSDFGIGATLGAEVFDKLQVSLFYQLGIRNIYSGPYDVKTLNRNVAVSVGFLIF